MRTVPTEENNDKLPLRFLPSFDSNVVASNDAVQDTSFPFDSFIRFDQCFSKNLQKPFFCANPSSRPSLAAKGRGSRSSKGKTIEERTRDAYT